jgi:hypothetical protein
MGGMIPYWPVSGVEHKAINQRSSSINTQLREKKIRTYSLCHPRNCPILPTFQALATSCTAMPLATRAKNATQHPGHIVLADMKKRRTKEDIAAAAKKKKVDEKTTKEALHKLYQFIANEEDHLAEDEVAAHGRNLPSSPLPQTSAHQDESTIWDSDKEQEVDANSTEPGKKIVTVHTSLTLTERNSQEL